MQLRNRKLAPPAPRRARSGANPHVVVPQVAAPPAPVLSPLAAPKLQKAAATVTAPQSYVSIGSSAFVSFTPQNYQRHYLAAQGVYTGRLVCGECQRRALFAYLFADGHIKSLCSLCGPTRQYSVPATQAVALAFHQWLVAHAAAALASSTGASYTIDCINADLVKLQ